MAYKTIELTLKNAEDREIPVLISTFPARHGIQLQAQLASILTSSGIALFSLFGTGENEEKEEKKILTKEALKQIEKLDEAIDGEPNKEKSSLLSRTLDFSKVDIEAVVRILLSNLDKKKITDLLLDICSTTVIDGKQIGKNSAIFDEVFSGDYGLLFEVVSQVLKANFSSFFSKGSIGKILSGLKEKISILPNLRK